MEADLKIVSELRNGVTDDPDTNCPTADTCDAATDVMMRGADEIERLRKMLVDHNICPDAEYIAPGGLRVDPPAEKEEPQF